MLRTADLSSAERLLVWRRREGLTQRQAARRLSVSQYRLRAWELGAGEPPRVSLGRLLPHESCFLLRRRSGTSLEELARQLGVTPWWLCQMEGGSAPVDRLLRHWLAIAAA